MRKVTLALLGLCLTVPAQADTKKEAAQSAEIKRLKQQIEVLKKKKPEVRYYADGSAQLRLDLNAANLKTVTTFYQRFFGDKDISAADEYLAPDYKQHNPLAATGRDAVKKFFGPFFANPAIPKTKIDIRRAAADGDLVWLHIRSHTTGQERAVVDIFRVKNGKILEHWDVIQPVPEKSMNENTMF